jgi:hypothetical protein
VVPDGKLVQIPDVPHGGTLLKERLSPDVYVIWGYNSHILSEQRIDELGLSWEDVEVAPDGGLTHTLPSSNKDSTIHLYDLAPQARLEVMPLENGTIEFGGMVFCSPAPAWILHARPGAPRHRSLTHSRPTHKTWREQRLPRGSIPRSHQWRYNAAPHIRHRRGVPSLPCSRGFGTAVGRKPW